MSIEEKINVLWGKGYNLPFLEYYSHLDGDCYKILNTHTSYKQEKIVLCKMEEGLDKALDLAIKNFRL